MFPQTRQCKKHSLNSFLKLAKTKNALRHQSCNVNARRVRSVATTKQRVKILYFKHFFKHFVFIEKSDFDIKKVQKKYIDVNVCLDVDCVDKK